jgi:hypothetical protein
MTDSINVYILAIMLVVALLLIAGCTTVEYVASPVPPGEQNITVTTTSVTFQPTPTPALTPTVIIRQIPVAVTPAPIAVSTTPDHVSKYADYNPALSVIPMGTALIITGGLDSYAAIHINSTDDNRTVNLLVNITPDGNSNRVLLVPGNYNAVLPDRYDNRTEQHDFFIGAGSVTYVSFNGYSYRQSAANGGCR